MYTHAQLSKLTCEELRVLSHDRGIFWNPIAYKHEVIRDILRHQGNLEEEERIIAEKEEAANHRKRELRTIVRTEANLKKLGIKDLTIIAKQIGIWESGMMSSILAMKGLEKKNKMAEFLTDRTIDFNRDKLIRYDNYYLGNRGWLRGEMFAELPILDFEKHMCDLCRNGKLAFGNSGRCCCQCHYLLRYSFIKEHVPLYLISCLVIEHYDVRFYMWRFLKHML